LKGKNRIGIEIGMLKIKSVYLSVASPESNRLELKPRDILMESLDWSKCHLVEIDPLRVSGRPVLKGTRMPVEDVIANYEHGVSISEISAQFQIPIETIRDLLTYVERRHALARPV
jgi:uncharacterized protein (DUF433 family)